MSKIILDEDNLYYIEVVGHQLIFHYLAYDETKYMAIRTLKEAVQQSHCFVQIHRSYIINMRYIYNYDASHVWLLNSADENLFNIGRSYRQSFKERYKNYLFSGSV